MAYDAVRAQLDKLLGPDRNGPLTDSASHGAPHYTDASVCKHYLLGFCPNDLYIKHRSEPGSCREVHSDAAKAEFEKDLSAGRAAREKATWVRALLRECRSIVADEDRKIRGHARRLQDTYCARGDLSGLMIRNFDTLKKLGMVSENAKIRVWNEDDDDSAESENGDPENNQHGNDKSIHNGGSKDNGEKQTNTVNGETGDKNSDDDEIDGFGVVKVIPANDNGGGDVDEFGRVKKATADEGENIAKPNPVEVDSENESPVRDNNGEKDTNDVNDDSDASDEGFGVLNVIQCDSDDDAGMNENKNMEATSLSGSLPSVQGTGQDASRNVPKSAEAQPEDHAAKRDGSDGDHDLGTVGRQGQSNRNKDANSTNGNVSGNGKEAQDRTQTRESNNNLTCAKNGPSDAIIGPTAEEIMDKFYKEGKGPDGLIMLDRKQSLRVCACCGGYISLVDAESRLLSHFGGKSHHSLVVLREKVVELEKTVLELEPRPGVNVRDGMGGKYRNDRDYHSMRSAMDPKRHEYDNDRPKWMRRESEHDRDRRRSGDAHGTYDEHPRWYDGGYERVHDRGRDNGQSRPFVRSRCSDREGVNGRDSAIEGHRHGREYYHNGESDRRGGMSDHNFRRDRYQDVGWRHSDERRRGRGDNWHGDGGRKRRRSISPDRSYRRSRRHIG